MTLSIGDPIPDFSLPATDGASHAALDGDASATVVVFTCNHCPYALAWQERLEQVARDYAQRGVRMLAINPNDVRALPARLVRGDEGALGARGLADALPAR